MLGRSRFDISTGGGATGAGAQVLARQIILAGVTPGGVVNRLYRPSSIAGVRGVSSYGPLAEAACYLFDGEGAPPAPMLLPIEPSQLGDASAVTHVGPGTGTVAVSFAPHFPFVVKISTAGTIGTMKFRVSYDGGLTWSDAVTSADSGSGDFIYRIPGTFCVVTFGAGTFVLNSTYTWGITSDAPTVAGGGINTVTSECSPIDTYEVRITIKKGGALGTVTAEISLDNGTATGGGATTIPLAAIASGGIYAIANTGLVLTFSGTFTADDTYSFVACPPGYSTSDATAALTALRADRNAPAAAIICFVDNPGTHTSAFALATVVQAALESAEANDDLDWLAMINVPCTDGDLGGDVVYDSAAKRSTTTSTNIRSTRLSTAACSRVSVFAGAHRVTSSITGWKLQRTSALIVARRAAETTPKVGVADRGGSALPVAVIGRDELTASVSLHDVQVNTFQTIRNSPGVWLSVVAGGLGWMNMTTDGDYQDADGFRMLNAAVAALRPVTARLIGKRPATNPDGTITELAARRWDAIVDGVMKKQTGIEAGGPFSEAQVSEAWAKIDRSSQLGQSPYELVVEHFVRRLGFVSGVRNKLRYTGVQ